MAVWTRDGQEVVRSVREVTAGSGSVLFALARQSGNLFNGSYTVTLSLGDTLLGRKSFVIGRESISY